MPKRKAWGGDFLAASPKQSQSASHNEHKQPCDGAEEEGLCRICFEPAHRSTQSTTMKATCSGGPSLFYEELIQPCACRGSVQYVHPSCLRLWRGICSGPAKQRCGVCLQPYSLPLCSFASRFLACLLPSVLSSLCIMLLVCGAHISQPFRIILACIAIALMARSLNVTALLVLLVMVSLTGVCFRGAARGLQEDLCDKVCLTLPRPFNLRGAPGNNQAGMDHQQEWRWPDSSQLEESLFSAEHARTSSSTQGIFGSSDSSSPAKAAPPKQHKVAKANIQGPYMWIGSSLWS